MIILLQNTHTARGSENQNRLPKKKPRISNIPCHSAPPHSSTPPNQPECAILESSFAESDPLVHSQKMSHRPDNIHERTKSSNNNNNNNNKEIADGMYRMMDCRWHPSRVLPDSDSVSDSASSASASSAPDPANGISCHQ